MEEKKMNNSDCSNEKKLIERVSIDNTPFTAVKAEKEWYLTFGNYIITKQVFLSVEQIKDYLKDPLYMWRTIATLSGIIATEVSNNNKKDGNN